MMSLAARVQWVGTISFFLVALYAGWLLTHEHTVRDEYDRLENFQYDVELLVSALEAENGELSVPDALVEAVTNGRRGQTEWVVLDDEGVQLLGDELRPPEPYRAVDYQVPLIFSKENLGAPVLYLGLEKWVELRPGQETRVWVFAARTDEGNGIRDSLSWTQILGAVAPIAGVGALVSFVVMLGLRGVERAGRELSVDNPIDIRGLPRELHPFAAHINAFVAKQHADLERETQFSGNVAHELRTPLAVLGVGLAVLERRLGQQHQGTLADLRATAAELSTLVENLLLLSRRALPDARTEVEVTPLVASVWALFEDRAQARQLAFTTTFEPGESLCVNADGLRAILSNLLSNASAYTEPGGCVRVENPSDGLLAVWDSGPVPPPDQLARLFDRLWRADEVRTGPGEHVGLGLSIARNLAESMGLELIVDMPASGGIRFLLREGT